jgi:hypothetical protein
MPSGALLDFEPQAAVEDSAEKPVEISEEIAKEQDDKEE